MLTISIYGESVEATSLSAALKAAIATRQWPAKTLTNAPGELNFLIGQSSSVFSKNDWRAQLTSAGLAFHVLHGLAAEQLSQALALSQWRLEKNTLSALSSSTQPAAKPWVWLCEKCSDPVCEHRLLSDLIAARAPA